MEEAVVREMKSGESAPRKQNKQAARTDRSVYRPQVRSRDRRSIDRPID